jgi:hypothetical protein
MQAPPPPPGPPPPQPYGYYVQAAPTNSTSVVSLVAGIAAWVFCPIIGGIVAVITGHVALGQIRTSGEQGRGMALAGVILGWTNLGLLGLAILVIVSLVAIGHSVTTQ